MSAEVPKLERVILSSTHSFNHPAFHHLPSNQSAHGSRAKQLMILDLTTDDLQDVTIR